MAKKKSNPSSTVAHKAAGRKSSLVWADIAQRKILEAAANRDQRPLSQFLLFHGLAAAEKILEKSS